MDKMPLTALVFQSIPESIILFALGLTLMGVPLRWKRIVPAAVILSLISYFVRGFPLPYGTHTLVHLFAMCALLIIFFRTTLPAAATGALLSLVTLGIIEIILWPIIFLITGRGIKEIWTQPVLRVLVPLPELILFGFVTWWCAKKKIRFSTHWPFEQKSGTQKQNRGHH
ncbi:MAG: hypothetical protein AB1556_10645 [Bacillota bacterium]